ncbi:MAG: nucleotidyltransferase domain-containing protein, partial [Pseudomonadota bacterium]
MRHLADAPDTLANEQVLIAEIDRLAEACEGNPATDPALRDMVHDLVATTLKDGRARVIQYLLANPHAGLRAARSLAHVTDVAVVGLFHFCSEYLHSQVIRTKGEHIALVAVGGYGRGEMAPFSDVDLLFLTPYKQTPWGESVIEEMLYLLWDLKLKVGHASRSIADCMRYARNDITVRTALLEKRFLCGDKGPFDELDAALWKDLFQSTGPEYVEAKLGEREIRHTRNGGARYMLEPNIKEGKGGLRDLQTLHWVSKYIYHSGTAW